MVVRPENEDLRVEIDDDGEAGGSQAAAGGLGLIGMRERVAGCGGRLTFGPRRHAAGWRVAAQLPRTIPAGGPAPDASSHHGRAAETVL